MKRTASLLIFLAVLGWQAPAMAGLAPSFSLEQSAWLATDIVVGTEGDRVEGELKVLEVWKGDGLKVGEAVFIPELRAFAPESARLVHTYVPKERLSPFHVTGKRMILFLKKGADASKKWEPATTYGGMNVSVLWMEQGKAYAFQQIINPGPSRLMLEASIKSDDDLKAQVTDVTDTQAALVEAAGTASLGDRARLVGPFVYSRYWITKTAALGELAKCGEAALPVLRHLLQDDTIDYQHDKVVKVLSNMRRDVAGAELTKLIETETEFWRQTAPKLQLGWRSGRLGEKCDKLLAAVRALEPLKYSGCKKAVTELRDFWRSVPQLEDIYWMSQACDEVLRALAESEGTEK